MNMPLIRSLIDTVKKRPWLFVSFALIVLVNLVIYAPSFSHIPRSDQIVYLAQASQSQNWLSLIRDSYSYNRCANAFSAGDPVLFRPLVFFILATERYLFGYHFPLWHIAGLLLHLAVVWQILTLFCRIRPGIFAGLWAMFFSVMFTNMEMVIWDHVNPYLLFVACIVLCLRESFIIMEKHRIERKQLVAISTALLVSCFLYEVGSIFCFVFFLFLWPYPVDGTKRRSSKLLILLPCLLYVSLNVLDWQCRHLSLQALDYLSKFPPVTLLQTAKNAFFSVYWWLICGLWPTLTAIMINQRTLFTGNFAYDALVLGDAVLLLKPEVFLVLAALVLYGWLFIKGFSKAFLKKRLMFLSLTVTLLFAQMATLILGRVNPKGFEILGSNAYFNYLVWVYIVIVLFTLIDADRLRSLKRYPLFKILCAVVMCILILINAWWVMRFNLIRTEFESGSRTVLARIAALIKDHGREKDFSFFVPAADRIDMSWAWPSKSTSDQKISDIELLFPYSFKNQNPKYVVSLSSNERLRFFLPIVKESVRAYPLDLRSWQDLVEIYRALGEKEKERQAEETLLAIKNALEKYVSIYGQNSPSKHKARYINDLLTRLKLLY